MMPGILSSLLSQLDPVQWLGGLKPTPELIVFFALAIGFLAIAIRTLIYLPNPKGRRMDLYQFSMPAVGESFEGPVWEYAEAKDKIGIRSLLQLDDPDIEEVVEDLEAHPDDYFFYIVKPRRTKHATLRAGWVLMLTHYRIDELFLSNTSMLGSHFDPLGGAVNVRVSNQAAKEGWVVREPKGIRIQRRKVSAIVYYPHLVDDAEKKTKVLNSVEAARGLIDIGASMKVFADADNERRISRKESEAQRRYTMRIEKLLVFVSGERNEALAQALAKRFDQISGFFGKQGGMPAVMGALASTIVAAFLFDPFHSTWPGMQPFTLIFLGGILGAAGIAILEYFKRSSVKPA